MAKEKINVDKLVKEISKGDVGEQAAVLKYLKDYISQKVQVRQQELASLIESLQ